MAGSINKVILLGRLGADPEVRVSQEGNKIARFSIATSETWKDKNTNEKKDRTCLLYTSPSPRDDELSRMPSSA